MTHRPASARDGDRTGAGSPPRSALRHPHPRFGRGPTNASCHRAATSSPPTLLGPRSASFLRPPPTVDLRAASLRFCRASVPGGKGNGRSRTATGRPRGEVQPDSSSPGNVRGRRGTERGVRDLVREDDSARRLVASRGTTAKARETARGRAEPGKLLLGAKERPRCQGWAFCGKGGAKWQKQRRRMTAEERTGKTKRRRETRSEAQNFYPNPGEGAQVFAK